jgi:HAD superfamily, subfamily IIIB (Acid phosphatase)
MSSRFLTAFAGASAVTLAVGLVSTAGTAWADNPLAPRTSFNMVVNPADGTVAAPTDGEAIPNIDSVKSTIRAYYNATGGIADKNSSRYITQVHAIENHILDRLPATAPANAALVFDVDDTLLWNYDFEDKATNFNFDPTLNGTWVTQHLFVKVPGMPGLLRELKARGYALYGITGRPAAQEADTIANLNEQGFTSNGQPGGTPLFTAASMYTKDPVVAGPPATIPTQPWVDCTADGNPASCSTVEYKALTRDHIASTDGVDLLMNVGDQWSDLQGGGADTWTKIPNPTYFLASPDLVTAPTSDESMVPPTSYVMQPDGSSGYSVASGDDIPNIDPVRKMIRGYYNADSNGIANKVTSPYITQLTSLESTWTSQVANNCTTRAAAYNAALAQQNAAKAKVAEDEKAVQKAKKAVKKAKTPAARKRAHQKLDKAKKALKKDEAALAAITLPAQPAVVFDADDTTLWTYDMEDGAMKFVFDPVLQGTWVTQHLFPAVPGMTGLVKSAAAAGCTVFGLTGRGTSQQADTIANLTEKGYVDAASKPLFTAAHYFTKGAVTVSNSNASIPTQPWVDCGSDNACSTIEYKSGTRAHIEDQGFDIVGNFGDQWSDLIGAHADHVYKLPNATYYLP